MTNIRAIETDYDAARFRSRIEARWAAFFNLIGWRYTYEPYEVQGWIPDFLIHGPMPLLVEVKPYSQQYEFTEWLKTTQGIAALTLDPGPEILLVGCDPILDFPRTYCDRTPIAGLLIENKLEWEKTRPENLALWNRCTYRDCNRVTVRSEELWFASRPCGHANGDHYLGDVDETKIKRLWNQAHSETRWAGK